MTDLVDLDELNKSLDGLVLNIVEDGKIQGIIKEKYPMLPEAVEAYREEMVRITSRVPKYVWDNIKEQREPKDNPIALEVSISELAKAIARELNSTKHHEVVTGTLNNGNEGFKTAKVIYEGHHQLMQALDKGYLTVEYDPQSFAANIVQTDKATQPATNKNDALYQYYTRLRKFYPENLILICTGTFYEALFKDALMLQDRYNTLVLHHSFSDGEPFPYASVHSDNLHFFLKENLKALGTVLVAEYEQGDAEVVQIYSLAGDKLNAEIISIPYTPLSPIEVVKNNRLDTNPLDNNNFDA